MHEYVHQIASPIGRLRLVATDRGLRSLSMERDGNGTADAADASADHPVLLRTAAQLREYFAGERTAFDLPLDAVGTLFQQQVWAALRAIPFGETRSYRAIAEQLGRPTATRAVGAANGRNPIAIVTPVSPGDRQRRDADRLRRGIGEQASAARPGEPWDQPDAALTAILAYDR